MSELFSSFFAFADYVFFAAADGLEFNVFVFEAVFAVTAVAVTFESNLEILLEYGVNNSNECAYAYKYADGYKNCLEQIIVLHNFILR